MIATTNEICENNGCSSGIRLAHQNNVKSVYDTALLSSWVDRIWGGVHKSYASFVPYSYSVSLGMEKYSPCFNDKDHHDANAAAMAKLEELHRE